MKAKLKNEQFMHIEQYDCRLPGPGLRFVPALDSYSGAYLGFLRKGKRAVILPRKGFIRDSR
jgi:hypothetical protein